MKSSMRPRLGIAGYFGAGNVGDEAILSAEIQSLKPYFDLLILSLDPERTMKTHKIDCAKLPTLHRPREIMRFFRIIARCDGLVIGGGGFLANRLQRFSIYNWLLLISIAKLLRKKVILLSVGCGPFRNGIHPVLIRYVLNKADIILLRDSISEHLLKQVIKINTPTRVTADMAFLVKREFPYSDSTLLETVKNSQTPRILFVICPRFHLRNHWKDPKYRKKYLTYVTCMGELADFVVEKMKGTPIFLPFYQDDVPFYIDILKSMKYRKRVILQKYTQNINSILSLFEEADVVIGARYHSIIFSIIAGVPVLPIIYHHKSYAIVKQINFPAIEVGAGIEWPEININITKAKQNLLEIYGNKQEYITLISAQKKNLTQKAMENVFILRNTFSLVQIS